MNAQSDGKNKLKRIEFVFANTSYKFILNPENYQIDEPNRSTLTQTKGSVFVDDFGAGVASINMSGTTGLRKGSKDPTTGFKKFRELRDLIRAYYSKIPPGVNIPSSLEMVFHNHTDDDHWVVTPILFSLLRSNSRPLLYMYQIQLSCLRPASSPNYNYISSDTLKARVSKLR